MQPLTLDVPVLETPRLRLRGHRLEDLEPAFAMWADPAVLRYISKEPRSLHTVWTRMLRYPGMWALLGYGYWAIEERATGRFIGEAGFADFKRDMEPSFGDTPEAGWSLCAAAHGKGYGTEAVEAVLIWGDTHFGPDTRTVCMIDAGNAPSIRLARKCGYGEYGRTVFGGADVVLFSRPSMSPPGG